MNRISLILLLLFFCLSCNSTAEKPEQNSGASGIDAEEIEITNHDILGSAESVESQRRTYLNNYKDFVPHGYKVFQDETVDIATGDLNNDGLDDVVFLIKKVDPSNIVIHEHRGKLDMNRRGIIVLFKKEDGFVKAVQNLDCFSSENEDGGVYYAPEVNFNIENGKLYVSYAHGRYGYWSYTFRYQKNDLVLIGYDSHSSNGPVPQNITSINFLTKKKLVRDNLNKNDPGDDYTENYADTWEKIEVDHLLRLSEIEDFDELQF